MKQLRMFDLDEVREVEAEPAKKAMELLGMEFTNDNLRQFFTFLKAMDVYDDRSKTRGQAWKQHPWYDSVHHIRDISSRFVDLLDRLMKGEQITDEEFQAAKDWAIDLINYSAFFIRKVEGD